MNTEKQGDGGKVWFVTGAGKGLGFEIARAALEAGHRVAATVRSRPEEITAALQENPCLFVAVMDVTDEAQVKAAVAQAVARFGRIDVLVNNAGYGLLSGIEEATDAEVRRQYDTNVFGLLNVTRAVLPQMRVQRSGHVINLSSLYGFGSLPGWGVYGSTKFAVEGITEALAAEVAPLGLFATTVEPGLFRTNFLDAKSTSRRQILSPTTRSRWDGCAPGRAGSTAASPAIPRSSRRRCSRWPPPTAPPSTCPSARTASPSTAGRRPGSRRRSRTGRA